MKCVHNLFVIRVQIVIIMKGFLYYFICLFLFNCTFQNHVFLIHVYETAKPSSVWGGDHHWWWERSRHWRQCVRYSIRRIRHHSQSPPDQQVNPPELKQSKGQILIHHTRSLHFNLNLVFFFSFTAPKRSTYSCCDVIHHFAWIDLQCEAYEAFLGFFAPVCSMWLFKHSMVPKMCWCCDFRSRTAFERSKTDVFRIRTHNVGPLKKIRYFLGHPEVFF